MNLYLFELSGRSILGYVNKKDLMDHPGSGTGPEGDMEVSYVDIEDMEYVTVRNPAIVSMSVVPVPGNIKVPGQQQQQITMVPVVLPYYTDEMILFVGNIMAVAEIPENHYFREEMKRIISHFRQIKKEENKFTPHVVQ